MFRRSLSLSTGALVFLGVMGFAAPLQAQRFRGGFRPAPRMTFSAPVMMTRMPPMMRFAPNGMMPPTPGMMQPVPNTMSRPVPGVMPIGFDRRPFRAGFDGMNRNFAPNLPLPRMDQSIFFTTGFDRRFFTGY